MEIRGEQCLEKAWKLCALSAYLALCICAELCESEEGAESLESPWGWDGGEVDGVIDSKFPNQLERMGSA